MFIQMLSLIFFGFIVYTFLVIVPSIVEHIASEEFRVSYFSHLASKYINSYGK